MARPEVVAASTTAWQRLTGSLDCTPAQAGAVWRELYCYYEADGRFYHNLQHIDAVLQCIDGLFSLVQNETAVRLAAWFHDVIYNPRADDNEAASAAWAQTVLDDWSVLPALIDEVTRLILLTRTHKTAADDQDGRVLLDADLAILGTSPEEYDAYAQAIRREYGFVPTADYKKGRQAVLQQYLQRPYLYFTPPMRAAREEQARQNIRRELDTL